VSVKKNIEHKSDSVSKYQNDQSQSEPILIAWNKNTRVKILLKGFKMKWIMLFFSKKAYTLYYSSILHTNL
jgi:hypothetical protein